MVVDYVPVLLSSPPKVHLAGLMMIDDRLRVGDASHLITERIS